MDQGAEDAEAPGGAGPNTRPGPDWAGLPEVLLEKVAKKLVAQTEAGWAAYLKRRGNNEEWIQGKMAERKRDGNCLFVFAMVCKEWRKAQLKVGGPLRTRVRSDVILPGSVALAKWALAEGCPREVGYYNMVRLAAEYGHHEVVQWLIQEQGFVMEKRVMKMAAFSGNLEMVRWLCGEGGFAMTRTLMEEAARSGNLELVRWLRGEGCPWDYKTCFWAVRKGHVEVLRWARENGCEWDAETRDKAAEKLGYTDDFGNMRRW